MWEREKMRIFCKYCIYIEGATGLAGYGDVTWLNVEQRWRNLFSSRPTPSQMKLLQMWLQEATTFLSTKVFSSATLHQELSACIYTQMFGAFTIFQSGTIVVNMNGCLLTDFSSLMTRIKNIMHYDVREINTYTQKTQDVVFSFRFCPHSQCFGRPPFFLLTCRAWKSQQQWTLGVTPNCDSVQTTFSCLWICSIHIHNISPPCVMCAGDYDISLS